MLFRLAILALVLGAEALLASYFLDGADLDPRRGLAIRLLREYGAWAVRFSVGFAALFSTFAFLRHRDALSKLARDAAVPRAGLALGLAHLASIAAFAWLSSRLYAPGAASSNALAAAWLLAAATSLLAALLSAFPFPLWQRLRALTGWLWFSAASASLAACVLGAASRLLWDPATHLTFALVHGLLRPVLGDIFLQPERMRLGTPRFSAIITPECSGLEGVALLLAFGVIWLILFRRECRFPQALLLLPLGVIVLFLLNSVRIAVLILIGDAGYRDVAARGFHSQAGWIAFNFVAFSFCVASRRLTWFSTRPPVSGDSVTDDNPTAPYLAPFLAILAAGMFARAVSGHFEWLYSLRLCAALAALWYFRRRYPNLLRPSGLLAPLVGCVVFVLWVALDRLHTSAPTAIPAPLAAATPAVRWLWIGLRVLGAACAVPLAEELAFRGYLLRRFISADFDAVPPRVFTWFSLLASSLLFGLLHGSRWFEGTLAGALYAIVLLRRGRLADAVVAHATTNLLLAVFVLLSARWDLW